MNKRSFSGTKLYKIFLIIFLVLLSILPRSIEVLNGNSIFLLDQGRDYLAVKNIVVNHKLTLIGSEVGGGMAGIQGIFHGPFHFYFLAIPFILFNGNPWGGTLLMFIFGLLTIGVGFIFGKRVFGTPIGGICMSLLIAISPPLIAQSRFVWNPHPSSFFILLALYFTYLLYKRQKRYFFLAAFFAGFIYNFETAIAAPISLTLLIYSVYLLKWSHIKHYFSLFGGFVMAYSPFFLFEFRHGFQGTKGIVSYLFLHTDNEKISFIANHLGSFSLNFIDTFPKQFLFPETFFLVLYILAFFYFVYKEKRLPMRRFSLFLLLLIGITFVLISFVRSYVFPYYFIHLNFVYIFIFSYVLISAYKQKRIKIWIVFAIFYLVFLATAVINIAQTFQKDYKDYGGMVKVKGKLDAIDYIYRDARNRSFGLFIFHPPVYTDPYDYLIWWYGGRKYNYIPRKEKEGTFYLLIEPDRSKPWSYRGWLETVIKTGKILYTKELPSGFIIQKRIANESL